MFIPWTHDQVVQVVKAITGWNTNLWELLKAGERSVTLSRVFNMREGFTRADDRLPERLARPHVTKTINEKPVTQEELDNALTMFYTIMGWDPQTGVPTSAKLWELGVPWAEEHLPK